MGHYARNSEGHCAFRRSVSIRARLQVLYYDLVPNTAFKYVRRGFQLVDERHRRLGVSLPLYVYTVRAFV